MITKKILIFILIIHLLLPSLAFSFSVEDVSGCHTKKENETFTRLCHNVDDIICKNVPDKTRRSCEENDKTIIHAGMNANEVYDFAKGCLKSAAHSFISFFTEFLPELCKAIWDISKSVYKTATSPGFFNSLKGAYESARSVAADTYEAIHKNPGAFFNNIWTKITDAVGPMVANYDCMNPQAKVEKICGFISEWIMPPAILAKIIVGGSKATKELVELSLIAKVGKSKASEIISAHENAPKLTLKEYQALFKQFKLLGYTLEDFKLMKQRGTLNAIELGKLKPITTDEGLLQYERLTGKVVKKENTLKPVAKSAVAASPELIAYKDRYGKELHLKPGANSEFMRLMEEDTKAQGRKIYFDVENSVQKTLNDTVFVDKHAVDAINNSFFEKFNSNLRGNKELMGRLEGEYKDYKSYRLRLNLQPGDDAKKYEQMLADLYKKTNNEFSEDLAKRKIAEKIPPRNDGLNTTTDWFLAGAGDNAIDANMAARAARETKNNQLSFFRDHTTKLNDELSNIEKLRDGLSSNKVLLDSKVMETTSSGKALPSKAMLNILRKTKPSEFATPEEYIAKIRSKSKNTFGVNLDDDTIISLTNYFKKVDAVSPPMFAAERTIINLDQAKHGIVSIDFAGVGVDNIYNQMKALTESQLKYPNPETALRERFKRMKEGIDQVSIEMNHAKETFSASVSKVEGKKGAPQFSGDDGIYMPLDKAWTEKDKIELVKGLAKSEDPSKFRVTFVESHYPNGEIIPSSERSKRIVRAETVEKDIRAQIIGLEKITDEEAKKFITAIDYAPSTTGGVFNLFISGKDFSPEEIRLIKKSIENSLSKDQGESLGKIIFK